MVDDLVLVDLFQPLEGERRAGAVAQQPLEPGPIVLADAHRGIEREAPVVPGEHVAGVVGVEQAAAGEPTQHSAAYPLGDGLDLLRCGRCGLEESDLSVVAALEYTVEDAAVEVAAERRPEAMLRKLTAPRRACAEAPGLLCRRWVSTARRKICRTAPSARGSRSRK